MIPLDLRDQKDKYAIKDWNEPIACLELYLPNLQVKPDEHILLGTINSRRGILFRIMNIAKLERQVINIKSDISKKEEYLWIRAEYIPRNSRAKSIWRWLWP